MNQIFVGDDSGFAASGKRIAHVQKSISGTPFLLRADVTSDPVDDLDARVNATPPDADRAGSVVRVVRSGTLTDGSGTIDAGGTAEDALAVNNFRQYLFVMNISAEVLWINFGVDATDDQPSIPLESGQSFVMEGGFVATQRVSIIGATTGSAYIAKEG
jgi:hypothetical protein